MNSYQMRESYRLHICWASDSSLTDEEEVLEFHRMCAAITPIMKRAFCEGYVNKLSVHREGVDIEIICEDVEYLFTTIAPVLSCFPVMAEGIPYGNRPLVHYKAITYNGDAAEEIEVDLKKHLPDCEPPPELEAEIRKHLSDSKSNAAKHSDIDLKVDFRDGMLVADQDTSA
ncbi:MAG: hypothetical protein WCL27_14895 [Betaproteobacteria bacterium]